LFWLSKAAITGSEAANESWVITVRVRGSAGVGAAVGAAWAQLASAKENMIGIGNNLLNILYLLNPS
jgi:hypothetical protein